MSEKPKRTDAEVLAILEREFDPGQIQQRPAPGGGKKLSYVSHGLVTQRLTEADPTWRSDVIDTHTWSAPDGSFHCVGVTMALTIRYPESGPVTRVESGGPSRLSDFTTELKVAQSDALKRCAMRFGVGLSMWEDLIDSAQDEDGPYRGPQPRAEINGVPVGRAATERPAPAAPNPLVLTAEQANAITRLRGEIKDEAWCTGIIAAATGSGSVEPGDLDRRGASSVIKQFSARVAKERRTAAA